MEDKASSILNPVCHNCGSQDFEFGTLIAGKESPGNWAYHRPAGSTWEDGDVPITTRRCKICDNVQLFATH